MVKLWVGPYVVLCAALALAPAIAFADMGPSCHCDTAHRGGRTALAGLIGAGGVAALLIDRMRRPRRS